MMKKKITFKVAAGILFLGVMGYTLSNYLVNKEEESISQVEKLRKKHADFLANSPFKETQMLSRKERKAKGLPPNVLPC